MTETTAQKTARLKALREARDGTPREQMAARQARRGAERAAAARVAEVFNRPYEKGGETPRERGERYARALGLEG